MRGSLAYQIRATILDTHDLGLSFNPTHYFGKIS